MLQTETEIGIFLEYIDSISQQVFMDFYDHGHAGPLTSEVNRREVCRESLVLINRRKKVFTTSEQAAMELGELYVMQKGNQMIINKFNSRGGFKDSYEF